MPRVHANNFVTTLNGDISSGATAIIITSTTGFPTVGSGTTANITLANGSDIEIVTCTARSGTTLTVTRGAEGTTPTAFVSGSTVSIRPTANSVDRKRDLDSYTTTATSAGTLTLTVNSTIDQFLTGSTTHIVVLPVVSTLALGRPFHIVNESSGNITVKSSGANSIQVMAANTILDLECILITGTDTASWYANYRPKTNPGITGDVVGPSSSTDNAIARFDSTTGKLIQNSVVTVSDTGTLAGIESITVGTTTVATNDKVLINDTSASDVTKTVTTQAIANLAKASSTTDNAVTRYDGTTGDFQNSGVIIDDSNNVSGIAALTATGHATVGGNSTAAGYIDLLEDTDNGSNKITLTAPQSIATDKTVTLQDVTGTVYVTGGTDVAVADGGTGTSSAGIGAFNNITGYTAAGATGTTSTNLVFSTSPTLVTPVLGAATATSINFGQDTLNNYDEGTFTPTFTCGTPGDLSVSYATREGVYTRIGNIVYIHFDIDFTPTFTTAMNGVICSGFPFTISGNNPIFSIGTLNSQWTWPTGRTMMLVTGNSGTANGNLQGFGTNLNLSNTSIETALVSGVATSLSFNGIYKI